MYKLAQCLFTAALPGDKGTGHVNCRPKEYWQGAFMMLGFYPDAKDEQMILEFMKQGYHTSWLIKHLQVFKREIS